MNKADLERALTLALDRIDYLDDELEHWIETGFQCARCGVDTREIHEYYMLTDASWAAADVGEFAMACIGCVEARLGRELTGADFSDAPVNTLATTRSDRLTARLAAP